MLNNTWFPKEVDMTQDIFGLQEVNSMLRSMAYDKVLAQLNIYGFSPDK